MKLVKIEKILGEDVNLAEDYMQKYGRVALSGNLRQAGKTRRQNTFFNINNKTYIETTLSSHSQRTIVLYQQTDNGIQQREHYFPDFDMEVRNLANKVKKLHNKTAKEEHKIPNAPDYDDYDEDADDNW